jgi:hypothetical protein
VLANLKDKKVGIINDKGQYGKGLADAFKKTLNEGGVTEVFNDALTPGDKDFSALTTRLKSEGVEVIYFGGYHPEGGLLARQLADLGVKATIIGGDGLSNSEFASIGGDSANGAIFTNASDALKNPDSKAAADALAARNIPAEAFTLNAYAAVEVLKAGIEKAGSAEDAAAVAAALKTGEPIATAIGKVTYGETGDLTCRPSRCSSGTPARSSPSSKAPSGRLECKTKQWARRQASVGGKHGSSCRNDRPAPGAPGAGSLRSFRPSDSQEAAVIARALSDIRKTAVCKHPQGRQLFQHSRPRRCDQPFIHREAHRRRFRRKQLGRVGTGFRRIRQRVRTETDGADVAWPKLGGEHAGKGFDAGGRDAVAEMPRRGRPSGRRRQGEHEPPPILAHVSYCGLAGVEQRGQKPIDRQHEVLKIERVDERALVVQRACGIHDHIDLVEPSRNAVDGAGDQVGLQRVDEEGLKSPGADFKRASRGYEPLRVPRADEDAGALRQTGAGHRGADRPRTAKDEDILVGQKHDDLHRCREVRARACPNARVHELFPYG